MSRTQARQDADTPYLDGHIFVPILPQYVTTGAGAVSAAPAAGQFAVSLPTTATAYVANIPIGNLLFRYGVQDDLQEFFGSGQSGGGAQGQAVGSPFTNSTANASAGANVSIAVLSSVGFTVGQWCTIDTVASGVQEFQQINAIPDGTHIQFATLKSAHTSPFPISQYTFTTPGGVTGRPPFTGVTEFSSVVTARPKGILIKAIYPVYNIGAVNATLNTIGLFQTTYLNNAPLPAPTAIIASGANGLITAFSSNVNITPIPVPIAGQVFRTARFTEYVLSWAVTTGTAGTATLYGVFIDATYNFN